MKFLRKKWTQGVSEDGSLKSDAFRGYSSDKPGLTRPGQSIDIGKAVARLAIGQDISTYVPQYFSEMDIEVPDMAKMDRLERLQWAADNADKIKELRAQMERDARNVQPQSKPDQSKPDPKPTPAPAPEKKVKE